MRKILLALVLGGTALLAVLLHLTPASSTPAVHPSPYPHAWEVSPT